MTIDAVLLSDANGIYDLQIGSDGDIVTEDFFDTAILVSLFTDRRASSSEIVESHRRRGWIGNEATPGIEMGSKVWLWYQRRVTRSLLNGISGAASDSLQWLVEEEFAISVTATAIVSNGGVGVIVLITRPNSKVERRFFQLWDNTGVQNGA